MKLFNKFIMIIATSSIVLLLSINICFSNEDVPLSLRALPLDGHLMFNGVEHASRDFGNMYHSTPSAVLHPRSVRDIATTIKHVLGTGSELELTVAARGHGHSLEGQAQARGGIVIDMESLSKHEDMKVFYEGKVPYVDVCAGELWINLLHECLKYGLAPKSWTDYLYLTVGGTLSNAGISGQAFRHGPQISNVHRLEVVTGRGEVMNCSEEENPELFHGILGGLGQFGIITRATISLEPAPTMVKWIRVVYSDFSAFTKDQQLLISMEKTFDYIEGFVIINRTGLLNNWRSSFNPQDTVQANKFNSDGRILFCLELAKYYKFEELDLVNQEIEELLCQLSYISSTLFESEVSYVDFLNRVHVSEMKLRSTGLWEVPHPWLNLLVPGSKIHEFADHVLGSILTRSSNGPILIYPLNKSKWDNRTSAIIPEEDIFYLVAFLSSAVPFSKGTDGLDSILAQNRRILEFCKMAQLGVKQYLPHYTTQGEWRVHFGARWQLLVERKAAYDPLAILAPGHNIFQRGSMSSS